MDECGLCLTQNSVRALCNIKKKVGPFWGLILGMISMVKDVITSLTKKNLMCDVRLNVGIIQHTYISFTTIAHHGAWLFQS
jgi:hypothetical protein